MSIVPVSISWPLAPLSSVVSIIRGVTYKGSDSVRSPEQGYLPVLRANNIQNGKLLFEDLVYVPESLVKEQQKIRAGDIIIAMSSGSRNIVGKAARADTKWDGGFGAFCGLLRPSNLICNKYISWFTYSIEYRSKVFELSAGVNINNLKPAHFDEINIPLAPLLEQQEIAARLDVMLAQVDTIKGRLDALPAILKRFRQSVLAAAVSGKLTEEWREVTDYDADGYPCIWEKKGFSDVGELARGKSKHRPRNDPRLFGDEYPFIQTGEVANSGGRITSASKYYSEFGLTQSKLFPADTLCITIAANIADTAILNIDACFPDSVVGFTANRLLCEVPFVKYLVDANKENLERFAPATAQKNINLKVLNELRLPFPPLAEQTEIVRRVEQLFAFADKVEQRVNDAQSRVNHLTQSILAKAFRGELTADWRQQHPELISGENSAEALLARIQAERAAQKPVKRAVKKKAQV